MHNWWTFLEKRGVTAEDVVGIDEVGRSPLAGPVCVAGVILPKNHGIKGIDDSKVMTAKKREQLSEKICKKAKQVIVFYASPSEIDRKGIFVCIKHLMRKVIRNSGADIALLDSTNVDLCDVLQMAVLQGDHKVDCIAAASIVAKVARDRLMVKLDQQYPGYGLANHKGYPTKMHRDAIRRLGMSEIHRKSFAHG